LEKIEMKKTLVAVAALAAVSGAMADVTVTGLVEAAYSTSTASRAITTGQNGGSEIRFGGSEDLGNGLKASFQYTIIGDSNKEGGPSGSTDTTSTAYRANGNVTNYNSFVGLSGDFGSLKLGNQFTPIFNAAAGSTAWGLAANTNSLVSPGVSSGGNGAVRDSGSITYTTPSISGLTVSVQGDANSTYTSASAAYSAGGLTLNYGFGRDSASKDSMVFGLAYDAGMAKLFVASLSGYLLTSNTTATSVKNKTATELGVSIPFGAATLVASTSTSNATSTKAASNLGVKYDLSKRTQVYYLNTVNGFQTSGGAAAGSVTNVFGVQHAF